MKRNYVSLYAILLFIIDNIALEQIHSEIINNEQANKSNKKSMQSLETQQYEISKIEELYVIKASIGSPEQTILLKISTLFKGICIASTKKNKDGFDESFSKTFGLIEASHSNRFGKGIIGTDILRIPDLNINIDTFPFFIANKPSFRHIDYAGLFGIAYSEEDSNDTNLKCTFDFFDYTSNSKRIQNIIGFKSINKEKGIMYYGELPSEVKQNKKLYKTCPITSKKGSHFWQCYLNAMYFDDGCLFPVNAHVDFLFGGNTIEVPHKVFWYMYDTYFQRYTECVVENQQFIEIVCDNGFETNKIGMISLIFAKWTLKIKGEQLFYNDKGHLKFSIITAKFFNHWIISPSILLNQYIFLDGNNNQIGFYHSDE